MDFAIAMLGIGLLVGMLATMIPMLMMNKKTLDNAATKVYEATNEGWEQGFDQGWSAALSDYEEVKKAYYEMSAENTSSVEAGTF